MTRSEALACIPVKNRHVREQRLENGEVLVLYPVTVRPWLAMLGRWLGAGNAAPRTGKLQLDRLGSAVWMLLDGQTPLRGIATTFAENQRLERKEAEVGGRPRLARPTDPSPSLVRAGTRGACGDRASLVAWQ